MTKRIFLAIAALCLALPLALSPANAQTQRMWVSSAGDDDNGCTRAAPCLTFQEAHDKAQTGGTINCADAGGFGGVDITKSITIDCSGTYGSVLVNDIVINGPGSIVNLHNITLICATAGSSFTRALDYVQAPG